MPAIPVHRENNNTADPQIQKYPMHHTITYHTILKCQIKFHKKRKKISKSRFLIFLFIYNSLIFLMLLHILQHNIQSAIKPSAS